MLALVIDPMDLGQILILFAYVCYETKEPTACHLCIRAMCNVPALESLRI